MSGPARTDALDQIAALAAAHGLTIEDIGARLQRDLRHDKRAAPILNRLLVYLGGTFVFAGLGLLVSLIWDDIGSAQRVIVTFGPGLTAFICGLLALKNARYERAATPLFLIAAFLQPTGLFVFMDEYLPHTGDIQLATLYVFGAMALQQGLAFLQTRRTSLLFFTLCFWQAWLAILTDRLDIDGDLASATLGAGILCLSAAIDKSPHRVIAPVWYFAGAVAALAGFFELVENGPLELAFLGVNAFFVYLSVRLASRTLLLVSIASLIGYLSWYTYKYFAHVTGWPVALIILGFILLGLGAWTVKLNRSITQS